MIWMLQPFCMSSMDATTWTRSVGWASLCACIKKVDKDNVIYYHAIKNITLYNILRTKRIFI